MLKQILASALSAAVLTGAFSGCAGVPANDKDKLSVVCTIFPEYDWTREIIGEQTDTVSLHMIKNGTAYPGLMQENYETLREALN